jgi:hyperosmotically inducible periplasmic protein
VGAEGLSFTAKNVKIITRNANVVLRGPVKNSREKTRIDELARACAGASHVDNQLEVESPN